MDFSQQHLVRILRLGFGLILVLNVVLGIVGLSQLQRVRTSMADVVEVNNAKMEYAYSMRDAVRLRALSTTKMLATNDYFERDAELIKFYGYAADYRAARDKLLDLGLNPEEAAVYEKLTERTRIAQPLNRAAAELLIEEASEADFRKAVMAARVEQDKVLQLLDRAISLEKRFSQKALVVAQNQSNLTVMVLLLAGVFIILLEAFIARKVIRFVTEKNQDMALKNEELAYASILADEATRAKTEFLANMSHEIRTPLTTIIGFSDSLANLTLSEAERQLAVESIHHSSTHLYDVINDILDISKIEIGSIEYEILEVHPAQLVADVLFIIAEKARNKGLELETRYDFPIPRVINTDPTRLKQILLNLCSNALKFTLSGKIMISVQYDQSENKISFVVEDTGIGMQQEQMANIFKLFQQADNSTTRRYGGTGLGLAISRQIARDLGGDIICRSEAGRGSVFFASISTGLDQVELVDEIIQYTKPESSIKEFTSHKGRVLLAEDSPDIQALLCMVLKRAGLEPTVAEDGLQASELALQQAFDLVLMDMQMPGMDGLQAIQRLRSKGYSKPIIMLSANAMQQNRVASLNAGAQEYLVKPIDFNELQRVLITYLPQSQHSGALEVIDPDLDDEFEQLVREFVAKLPDTIKELQSCSQSDDLSQLSSKAHKLKGIGASFGFPELSKLAKALMVSAAEADRQCIAELIEALDQRSREIVDKTASGF